MQVFFGTMHELNVTIFDHQVVIGARHIDLSDLNFFPIHGVSDRNFCVAREYDG